MAILGELDRAGLIHTRRRHRARRDARRGARPLGHRGAPAARRVAALLPRRARRRADDRRPSARSKRFDELDLDRANGVIRDVGARLLQGRRPGRALRQPRRRRLHREDRRRRCQRSSNFSGPARVFESQDAAVDRHPRRQGRSRATSSSSATRARAAAPACRRCSIRPATSSRRASARPARSITDGRFSGGTSGLSIGHVSPEAAEGGADRAGAGRRHASRSTFPSAASGWRSPRTSWRGAARRWRQRAPPPGSRSAAQRKVSTALKAYAALTTSAARGAVRDVTGLRRG